MKKVILIVGVLLIFVPVTYAQVIKIDNGLSVSSMKSNLKDFNLFGKKIYSYSMSVGCDYLERGNFYLSSELGYIRTGGKAEMHIAEIGGIVTIGNMTVKSDFLHLNTTFRVKFPAKRTFFYVGFGPKIDFLLTTKTSPAMALHGYTYNKALFGFKPEIGYQEAFGEKFIVGVNAAYLINTGRAAHTEYVNLKNNMFLLKLSLGYRL